MKLPFFIALALSLNFSAAFADDSCRPAIEKAIDDAYGIALLGVVIPLGGNNFEAHFMGVGDEQGEEYTANITVDPKTCETKLN